MNRNTNVLRALLVLAASATLAAGAAELHNFTNLNRLIPDGNLAGMSDTHSVTSTVAQITSLRVRLKSAGEFNGDLYGYVRHIGGGRTNLCVLLNRPGRTAANPAGYADAGLDVVFDDAAGNGDIHLYQSIAPPLSGTPLTNAWQPDGRKVDPMVVSEVSPRTATLGSFAGADPNGEWTVYLVDTESGGTNQLVSWSLEISGATVAPVTWPAPADIVYGTPLAAAQLNASSPVAGSFTYNPPAGTVLSAGAGQTLSVTFTPLDTATYSPTTTNVSLTVLQQTLAITAENKGKVYGAALPTPTASYSGFVNGDTAASLDTPVNLATTATAGSAAGTYPITASGAADANYSITYTAGTLTVTAAPLTITAENKSKVYGAALPTLTASYSGFVNGDTMASLDTPVNLATTATAGSAVGAYPITAGGATDANYSITYAAGTLTVTPAALVITAENKSKVYGAALPTLTASYSGFVNGDTVASLDTPVNLATTATAGSAAGTYPITASGAADANYSITYTAGTLTVTAAPLTITAENKSKVYGAALPTLTASYSGFVNGDTMASLDTPVNLATTATAGSAVGAYPITAGGATDANYSIAYAAGTLTVTAAGTTGLLISSANPASPGASVTFTYTLSATPMEAGAPVGAVQFKVDGLNAGPAVPLTGGVAAYSTTSLALGLHSVTAEYPGSLNCNGTTNTLAADQLINTSPVAGADTIERWPTNGSKVAIIQLLTNDSDADGDAVTWVSFNPTSAAGGTVTELNGWLTYAPPAGFTNTDNFTYTISDGRGAPVAGTVTVAIKVDLVPSPNLVILNLGNGSYHIWFDGVPGKTYRIEYTDNLETPDWRELGSATADASGMFEYLDTAPPGSPTRYYRSVYP